METPLFAVLTVNLIELTKSPFEQANREPRLFTRSKRVIERPHWLS